MKRKARYYTELNFIDTKTGEVIRTPALILGQEPSYVDTQDHVKVFVTFLQDLIVKEEITKGAIRLLLYMIKHLEWNSLKITIIPRYVIKELRITKPTFYTWLEILIRYGIIKKIDSYTYELKPYTSIKGSQQKQKAIEMGLAKEERKND